MRAPRERRPRGGNPNFRSLEDLCKDFKTRRGEPAVANGTSSVSEASGGEQQNSEPLSSTADSAAVAPAPGKSTLGAWPNDVGKPVYEGGHATSISRSQQVGVLKKLFREKGFGFLALDGSQNADVFLHFSDLCNGGSEDMATGIQVCFDPDVDPRTGKIRARNAVIAGLGESTQADDYDMTESECESTAGAAVRIYGLEDLLRARRSLQAAGRLGTRPKSLPIRTLFIPWSLEEESDDSSDSALDDEDLDLDDEACVAALEVRLSAESGADRYNNDTFGEECASGWTFEEAVQANAELTSATAAAMPEAAPYVDAAPSSDHQVRRRVAQLVQELSSERSNLARGSAARALMALLGSSDCARAATAAVAEGAAEALTALLADPGAGDEARNVAACAIGQLLDIGGKEAMDAAVAAGAIAALSALVEDDAAAVQGDCGDSCSKPGAFAEDADKSTTGSPSLTSLRLASGSEDTRFSSESEGPEACSKVGVDTRTRSSSCSRSE
eukprot:TRINITY_DN24858_c0_g1_i1.p1 TRINITY_DN24858_c0_g1~~TRINITY_DN24858_c0_g1_i1.p1  ORF type:complete len:502 (+),score=120.86 TRINITY_DN24858_c0_g1_i1:124-1629(+)